MHHNNSLVGKLYVVATPIGNLKDITLRAIETLRKVDLIACEDTRKTKILLDHFTISKPLVSYHQHSPLQKADYIIRQLKSGKNIALVCNAGTPNVDDPGSVLVAKASEEGIKIIPIPGPSSLSVALSVCGFLAQRVLFLGFLPKKKGRQTLLEQIPDVVKRIDAKVIVIFESPYRLVKTLSDLRDYLGDQKVALCRELTKKFEEIYRGKLSEAVKYYTENKPKGEFTICLNFKK